MAARINALCKLNNNSHNNLLCYKLYAFKCNKNQIKFVNHERKTKMNVKGYERYDEIIITQHIL